MCFHFTIIVTDGPRYLLLTFIVLLCIIFTVMFIFVFLFMFMSVSVYLLIIV